MGSLSGLLSQAVGQPRLLSTWGNLSSLSVIAAILIGLPWGAEGVAIAFAARAYLGLPLTLATSKLATGIGTAAFVRASAVPFMAAGVMGASVAALGFWLQPQFSPALGLAVQVLVGAAIYLFILNAVAPDALREVITLLRRGDGARV
jgi:PST family polysaccharide transporter